MNNASASNGVLEAVLKLDQWVERANWKAYDPFDGNSSPFCRYLTFGQPFLQQVWLHVVRRFPVNLRPLLRIPPDTSSKAMGFFASGYLRLYQTHRRPQHLDKSKFCLQWLLDHPSQGYSGYCWGNHFGGRTRGAEWAGGEVSE